MTITAKLSDWYWNLSPLKKLLVRGLILLAIALVVIYVFFLPLKEVPMEVPIAKSSIMAAEASEKFWDTFWADATSEALDDAIVDLTAAFDAGSGNDKDLNSLLSGAHMWRFMRRNETGQTAEQLRPDLVATLRYAQAVVDASPPDTMSTQPSFVAGTKWMLAIVDDSLQNLPDVHIDIIENSIVYPTFAGFVQGWVLGTMLEIDNPHWEEVPVGYNFMMNTCSRPASAPNPPVFTKFIHSVYSIKSIWSPECYNNPVAPHNIEGTFMTIGDAYLKRGDIPLARLWYQAVKTAATYDTWRYQDILEDRLARSDALGAKFREDAGKLNVTEPAMSFQSEISCGICHAR